jgi:hypothetical protein
MVLNATASLGFAQAAALAVQHAMEADPRVVVLGEDVGRGGIFGQYKGLQQAFGAARVIDTPISEAAILGAGVGMALAGLRPVVEMRVVDFALCGMDEVVNQAAKNRFMFGGQGRVPMVVRMPIGIWDASAAQHSQSLEAWFAHVPGWWWPARPRRRTTTRCCAPPSPAATRWCSWNTRRCGASRARSTPPCRCRSARRAACAAATPSPSSAGASRCACASRLRRTGRGRHRRRPARPAQPVALGPRRGARVVPPHRPAAGGARGGAGGRLRRRDRRHRGRTNRLPRRPPGRAAHPGGLLAHAGSAVAGARGSHRGSATKTRPTSAAAGSTSRPPARRCTRRWVRWGGSARPSCSRASMPPNWPAWSATLDKLIRARNACPRHRLIESAPYQPRSRRRCSGRRRSRRPLRGWPGRPPCRRSRRRGRGAAMAIKLCMVAARGPLAGFMSVSTGPGCTLLTVMPRGPRSRARPCTRPSAPTCSWRRRCRRQRACARRWCCRC